MNFFKNFRFAQKISVLTASFFIFLAIIGYVSFNQISDLHSKVKELNDSRLVPIVQLEDLKSNIEYIKTQSTSIMDARDDAEEMAAIQKDVTAKQSTVKKQLTAYKNNANYTSMIKKVNAFLTASESFIQSNEAQQTVDTTIQQGANAGPPAGMVKMDSTRKAAINALDKLIDNQVKNAQKTYDDSKSVYKTTLIIIISVLVASAIITLLLSVVITRSIVIPLKNVTSKLKEISESNGDLTQRIGYSSKDEIGQLSRSFDMFIIKLWNIIKEVASSSETISASSGQLNEATGATVQSLEMISKTVGEIASGTAQGAAFAEQTTSNLMEAVNFSESTALATRQTTDNTLKAKQAAEDGAGKISKVVDSITNMAASSKDVTVMINDLNESSKKIGEIIQIISGISAQTNLLALNAAIEAARAGEAGKGFSVVAEEIRKLADQSNSAAVEISELVKDNQTKSVSAVQSVHLVEEKVSEGVKIADEVGESIQNIMNHIQDIVNQVEQIDKMNTQQADSSKEMRQAVANLADASSEIAAGTEHISKSIDGQVSTMNEIENTTNQLTEMAKRLKELTSGFKI